MADDDPDFIGRAGLGGRKLHSLPPDRDKMMDKFALYRLQPPRPAPAHALDGAASKMGGVHAAQNQAMTGVMSRS